MGRRVVGGVGWRGLVVTVVLVVLLLQVVLRQHVGAVGRRRDAAEVEHGPAAVGAE